MLKTKNQKFIHLTIFYIEYFISIRPLGLRGFRFQILENVDFVVIRHPEDIVYVY